MYEEDLSDVIELLHKKTPYQELVGLVKSWRQEPMRKRLLRIANQAQSIANRLEKGNVHVKISDNRVRLPQDKWSPFWSVIGHVIRNAIDHGLEPKEERLASGKPEHGTLELMTEFDEHNLVIQVRDDGKGIDWDKLKDKAMEKGRDLGENVDLVQALFEDGVSTKDHATIYSGRGVGMSAVKQLCDRMGGRIEVVSSPGEGTCFEFKFPLDKMDDWKLSA